MKRMVRSLTGLQRTHNAAHNRLGRLYGQPYILLPALARHLAQFDQLSLISDPAERYEAFRHIPALEYDLEAIYASLGPKKRESLAQQGRAKHRRVRMTQDGATLERMICDLLEATSNSWGLKAKQLWPPLIRRMTELGLNPTMIHDPADPSQDSITYSLGEKRRTLSLGQFQNVVSRLRRRSRTSNDLAGLS